MGAPPVRRAARSASVSRPWRTRSSAIVAAVGAPICGMLRACVASALSSARSASGQRPVASSTSACAVRQAPSSGAASCVRANSSTSAHHSVARSQSPALTHAVIRLQYDSPSVCTLRTRPDDEAAIASSSRLMPSSARPAFTVARPSRLIAKISRSLAPVSRAIFIARRACSTCSSALCACRARSTATQPCPAHCPPASSSDRSARASQPRAADARPPIRCWCDTQTATRAASSHRSAPTYASKARSRAAMPAATSPRNHSAWPSPS